MRLIGLCGRSGSGKSVFAEVAKEYGITVVDCDELYAEMVSKPSPCLAEIEKNFGVEAVKGGALDREYMAPLVFGDKQKLALLNKITHKHITSELEKIFKTFGEDEVVILDAPTLFESGLEQKCELIISVIAPYDDCVKRITERDNIPVEKAEARLASQKTDEFLIENSDILVYNDSSLQAFETACGDIAQKLKGGSL